MSTFGAKARALLTPVIIVVYLTPASILEAQRDCDWNWVRPYPQGLPLHDILWDGSRYVAVGYQETVISSPDLLNWTIHRQRFSENETNPSAKLEGIATSGSDYVAVGYQSRLWSDDGEVWIETGGGHRQDHDVAFGNGKFAAVGTDWDISCGVACAEPNWAPIPIESGQ